MRNVTDAIPPAGKASKRLIDGSEKDIAFPEGWQNGTTVNRDLLMAMQGFDNVTTTFDQYGNILETNGKGETLYTEFPNGNIRETFTANGQQMIKITTFNPDGSISEVIQ